MEETSVSNEATDNEVTDDGRMWHGPADLPAAVHVKQEPETITFQFWSALLCPSLLPAPWLPHLPAAVRLRLTPDNGYFQSILLLCISPGGSIELNSKISICIKTEGTGYHSIRNQYVRIRCPCAARWHAHGNP